MPTNDSELQARRILDEIAFMPFEQCQPLNRRFENIPSRPGIYAVRHKTEISQPQYPYSDLSLDAEVASVGTVFLT
jgi:hypothetical protein